MSIIRLSQSQISLAETILEMTNRGLILKEVYDTGNDWVSEWSK